MLQSVYISGCGYGAQVYRGDEACKDKILRITLTLQPGQPISFYMLSTG